MVLSSSFGKRSFTPEMVHREVWSTLLAYNLILTTIALAANLFNKRPRQISLDMSLPKNEMLPLCTIRPVG